MQRGRQADRRSCRPAGCLCLAAFASLPGLLAGRHVSQLPRRCSLECMLSTPLPTAAFVLAMTRSGEARLAYASASDVAISVRRRGSRAKAHVASRLQPVLMRWRFEIRCMCVCVCFVLDDVDVHLCVCTSAPALPSVMWSVEGVTFWRPSTMYSWFLKFRYGEMGPDPRVVKKPWFWDLRLSL